MNSINNDILKEQFLEHALSRFCTDSIMVDNIVDKYLFEDMLVQDYSIEYAETYEVLQKKFLNLIRKINRKYINKRLEPPFEVSEDETIISPTLNFSIFVQSLKKIDENPHLFATDIGLKVLKTYGVVPKDYHPTSDIKDGGYDFYGYLELNEMFSAKVLFIGEVKLYNGKHITVEQIRSFVGAYTTAIKLQTFPITVRIIPIYITASDFTKEAVETASTNGIVLIDKATLISFGLL